MPSEPPPTTWTMVRPTPDHPHDVWGLGADLLPGTLLSAYRAGMFPMRVGGDLLWWSPQRRALIEVAGFRPTRSLRRAARAFEIRIDTHFEEVMVGCADVARPDGWIDSTFIDAYCELHRLGWAHSVEAWDDAGLAGGLYGVAVGGLFAAESMFFRRSGASKAALLALVDHLAVAGGGRVIDVQWSTPHLASLGATEFDRATYHAVLDRVLPLPDAFASA